MQSEPKRKLHEKTKALSRAQLIVENGGRPLMPPVDEAVYLVGYWQQLGLVAAGGFGPVTLSALEIKAWSDMAGVDLSIWEFKMLREMSRAYLVQFRESEEPECPAPYGHVHDQFDRDKLAKRIKSVFMNMSKAIAQ